MREGSCPERDANPGLSKDPEVSPLPPTPALGVPGLTWPAGTLHGGGSPPAP